MRKLTVLVVIVFCLAIINFQRVSADDTSIEKAIFDKVNAIRIENNLNPLDENTELKNAANIRATEITLNFSHTRPDGSDWYTVDENIVYGENLARGYETAEDVVNAWMESPKHRKNILSNKFTTMAISLTSKDSRNYFAQEFGA